MDTIYKILEYSSLLLFLVVAFSFGAIKSYLVNRGLVRWKLAYWNPFDFFEKYIEASKEETGKTGVWIKVMIYAACGAILIIGTDVLLRFIFND